MTHAYLVFASEDLSFAQRLSADLTAHNISHLLLDQTQDISAAEYADFSHAIVILSEQTAQNAEVINALKRLDPFQPEFIALRVGPVKDFPDVLKQVLPLDFSHTDQYQESLATLLEDLLPAKPVVLLPPELLDKLESSHVEDRRQAIQHMRDLYKDSSPEGKELIEEKLRNIVFRDSESGIKMMARAVLQALSQLSEPTEVPTPSTSEPLPSPIIVEILPDAEETIQEAPAVAPAVRSRPAGEKTFQPVWQTSLWTKLPGIGVFLGFGAALLAQDWITGITIAVIWFVLPSVNLIVRDGGRFEWEMPQVFIGNSLIGFFIGLLGTIVGIVVAEMEGTVALATILLSVFYSGAIGWLSTVQVRTK